MSPAPRDGETVHEALHRVATAPGQMTIGLELPLDNDWSATGQRARRAHGRLDGEPDMSRHLERAVLADRWDFAALWLRDVPLYDAGFGDAGQVFDPFPYLGYLACATSRAILGTAAIALPLRHPLHVAKMAATIDRLSGGRLLLGVASGDRPVEFPLFGVAHERRADLLREGVHILKSLWDGSDHRDEGAVRLLPTPARARLPLVIAGRGGQPLEWIAENVDGYFTYHRTPETMEPVAAAWHDTVRHCHGDAAAFKPLLTTMLVDLCADPHATAAPTRFGARLGRHALLDYLRALRGAGVNHVAINLRPCDRPVDEAIEEIGQHILPEFPSPRLAPQPAPDTPRPVNAS